MSRSILASRMSEKDWQAQVLDLMHTYGWMTYHTFDSRRSEPGFPDIIAVRGGRQIAAELKRDNGIVTPEQIAWLEALRDTGVETYVWRPADFDTMHERLKRPGPAGNRRAKLDAEKHPRLRKLGKPILDPPEEG